MTKQRMAGYTPLRSKGGVQPEAPANAKEIHTTQPVTAEPIEAPVPMQTTPAAVTPPEQKAVPAEAPVPVVPAVTPAEASPAAAESEVSRPETTSTRQRMAGYTPLRLRDGLAASVAATMPVDATSASPASAYADEPATEVAPAAVHAPAAPSVESESAPAAAVAATPIAEESAIPVAVSSTIPANRMKGYTPVRPRDGSTASGAASTDLTTEESSKAQPVAESVSESAVVASPATEQPETSQEAKAKQTVAEPVAEEALAPQTAQTAANIAPPVTDAASPAVATPAEAAKPATAPVTAAKQDASSIKMKPWVKPAVIILGAVLLALLVVLAARGLRLLSPVQNFIGTYDGHSTMPDSAPTGIPGWLGWQHFLNMFFIVLIIRTGLQVRHEKRPAAMWTPKPNSWFSPKGNSPKKYSLSIWTHQVLDVLWVVNGVIFVILLAVTGQWMRVVPTSWDIFPNMLSGALQYASLNWPVENGWIHYNALQMVSYFLVIYIAAPLAILTGVRMSSWWPTQPKALNKFYPVEVARKIHFPVMLFFSAFIVVHVFLVLTTGALKNLNHMYSSRDATDAWGLVIFLVSVAVIAAAWIFMKPMFLLPVASATGKISKN